MKIIYFIAIATTIFTILQNLKYMIAGDTFSKRLANLISLVIYSCVLIALMK